MLRVVTLQYFCSEFNELMFVFNFEFALFLFKLQERRENCQTVITYFCKVSNMPLAFLLMNQSFFKYL